MSSPSLRFLSSTDLIGGISIRNSIIFVIASEAKQSLGILEFSMLLRGFEKRGSNLIY